MAQEKLIITVTVAPSWIYPDAKNAPRTPDEVVESVVEGWKAGAAIAHVHGVTNFTPEVWKKIVKDIRDKTDVILQIGLSALQIPDRMAAIKLKPDMLSIILNHHD